MKKHILRNLTICTSIVAGLSCCKDSIELEDVNYPSYSLQESGYEGYTLEWSEDFKENGLPSDKSWGYEEGYCRNFEWQDYKKADEKHSFVKNGSLFIRATTDPHEGVNPFTNEPYQFEYSSASVTTKGKKSFKYGRIDIAAKVPKGISLWPSLWLMPENNIYGTEAGITIMEHTWGTEEIKKSSTDGEKETNNIIRCALTTQGSVNGKPVQGTIKVPQIDQRYHLYSLVWEPKKIQILMDNQKVLEYTKEKEMTEDEWPFDQPFYLAMSLAVGGTKGGTHGKNPEIFPKDFEIKYIRYYKSIYNEDIEDGEDEEDKPGPAINYVVNGDFEGKFEEGKDPEKLIDSSVSGEKLWEHTNQWFAKDEKIEVINTSDSGKALKQSGIVKNWWTQWVRHAIQGITPGKYTFSFKIKNNKAKTDGTPFAACIGYCKSQEDIDFKSDNGKTDITVNMACIYLNEGTQKLIPKNDDKPLYPVITGTAKATEWTEYTAEIEIPENVIIMINFGLNLTWDSANNKYTSKNEEIEYLFDNVSLTPIQAEKSEK